MHPARVKIAATLLVIFYALALGGCSELLDKLFNKKDSESNKKLRNELLCLECDALKCEECQKTPTCTVAPCGCDQCRNEHNNTEPNLNETNQTIQQVITTTHRFHQGQMFGGWGPHLGKLLRDPDGTLWFADDTGNNVEHNPDIAYYRYANGKWTLIGSNPTAGKVRQNMGSVMTANGIIYSYGVDIENHKIQQCWFNTKQNQKDCSNLLFSVDEWGGYIGAALNPSGNMVVWWTTVRNGGAGGFFHYIYFDGTKWNGPINSAAAGFNNVAYINIAFESDTKFAMLGQGLKGDQFNQASWKFTPLLAEGTLGTPVIWNAVFTPIDGSEHSTSNDIWKDASGGSHILVRAHDPGFGSTAYFYQPKDGAVSNILFKLPLVNRARFIHSNDNKLFLIYGIRDKGLQYRVFDLAELAGPIDWEHAPEVQLTLPEGYERVQAIYPESRTYQTTPLKGVNVAVNGDTREGEVLYVRLR